MSENKDSKSAPFNPLFYEEENFDYPSDSLTLRDLRLVWPDPGEMEKVIGRARFFEHSLAFGVAVDIDFAAKGEPQAATEPSKKDIQERQYLKEFYVATGLATGDHAAELLIRGIEERARRQYHPKTPPRLR